DHGDFARRRRRARGWRASRVPRRTRQSHAEDAALTDARADVDASAMVGDDALRDREPETGSLPRRLRREEGLEDPRQHVVGNAGPGVGEFDLDLVARGAG